jgi:rhodanese-related sulfurtransferase
MPLQQLKQQLEQIADYKDKPVMTICRTDRRSSEAARILIDQGFENVKVVRKGMTGWIKQDYPIVKAGN